MESAAPDRELVACYAHEGSEAAFRALVGRHVNLVFAAAFRQVGDASIAEEITQNVFVALARKAPRLAGHETLAGWLHRTAILEAKARIRAELRRRRREEAAAELVTLHREGRSPAEDLTPLLDEALLNLREPDRVALALRFLEERSLREVGAALGVDEDAARKRVARALERLTGFFRAQGIAVPSAAAATLLTNAGKAAPAGLAVSVSNAGLAAGGPASGLTLVLLQLMTLTKTQTAVVCALLATLPLGWQWKVRNDTWQAHTSLASQLAGEQAALTEAETEGTRLGALLQSTQADTLAATRRLAELESRRAATPPQYRWDDTSPVARIPKSMLAQWPLDVAANRRGQLTEQIRAALQLTAAETTAVQASLQRFLESYHAAQARALRPVEPEEHDLSGHPRKDVRVFEVAGLQDTVTELRNGLFAELGRILDAERLEIFTRSLRHWMPVDDTPHGINTGMAVFAEDLRLRFFNYSGQSEGEPFLGFGLSTKSGSLTATIPVVEIPPFLKPHLQDWIDQVLADRATELVREAAARKAQP